MMYEIIAATVVSAMEQMCGRLAQIHRATTAPEIVEAFTRFQEAFTFYRTVPVLPDDATAAAPFARLRQDLQRRPGTQDLRIAANRPVSHRVALAGATCWIRVKAACASASAVAVRLTV